MADRKASGSHNSPSYGYWGTLSDQIQASSDADINSSDLSNSDNTCNGNENNQFNILDSIHVGNKKLRRRALQCIVGVTNPFLLRTFSKFQNAIFIPSDAILRISSTANVPSSLSVGSSTGITKFASRIFPLASLFGSSASVEHKNEADTHKSSLSEGAVCRPDTETRAELRDSRPTYGYTTPNGPPPLYRRTYTAKMRNLSGTTTSLETIYDDWLASGGAGGGKSNRNSFHQPAVGSQSKKMGYVLLIYRGLSSCVTADRNILHKLSQFSSGNAAISPNGIDQGSDAFVLGGELLRDYFRSITLSLLRPFESMLSPLDHRSNLARKDTWADIVCSIGPGGSSINSVGSDASNSKYTSSLQSKSSVSSRSIQEGIPASLSVKRVGAGSLWLYADATTMLGNTDPNEALRVFMNSSQTETLPVSIFGSKGSMSNLLLQFFYTDHFQIWSEWRRNCLISQLCFSMIETSKNISMEQLLAAFAIELNAEILTCAQLTLLSNRIEKAMANVRAINSCSSVPELEDRILCAHMQKHLDDVNRLIFETSNITGSSSVMYSNVSDHCV